MKASAWKVTNEKNSPHCIYWMQVDKVKHGSMAKLNKVMKDWDNIGSGSSGAGTILIYKRDFGDQDHWLSWAKDFDAFDLVELDKNGKPKKYVKVGAKSKEGGRTCGKCGEKGHNSRTCGRPGARVSAVKAKGVGRGRGKRTCALCGLTGHNSRTCGKPAKAAKSVPGKRRCGKCGDLGHNARTCGKR